MLLGGSDVCCMGDGRFSQQVLNCEVKGNRPWGDKEFSGLMV